MHVWKGWQNSFRVWLGISTVQPASTILTTCIDKRTKLRNDPSLLSYNAETHTRKTKLLNRTMQTCKSTTACLQIFDVCFSYRTTWVLRCKKWRHLLHSVLIRIRHDGYYMYRSDETLRVQACICLDCRFWNFNKTNHTSRPQSCTIKIQASAITTTVLVMILTSELWPWKPFQQFSLASWILMASFTESGDAASREIKHSASATFYWWRYKHFGQLLIGLIDWARFNVPPNTL